MNGNFRKRVAATIFCCAYGIFILYVVIGGVMFFATQDRQQRFFLQEVIETNGFVSPRSPAPKGRIRNPIFRDMDFFYVESDRAGKILTVRPDRYESTSRAELNNVIREINKQGAQYGKIGNFKFLSSHNDKFAFCAIMDISAYEHRVREFFSVQIFVMAILLVSELLIAFVASRYIVEIFSRSIDLQQRFIADASHEIRTPLSSILANVGVLELELDENKWLSSIKSEVGHLKKLSDELLLMARIGDKEFESKRVKFNLSEELASLAISFEPRAFQERRNFVWSIEPACAIVGFPERMRRLVSILLDNAIKYSEERSKISLELASKGKSAVLSVYNTGKGVSENEKDKIFQRFYRADKSRSGSERGFGLGLSIAAEIAAMHKSSIRVDGDEGKWIRFSISLDLA